MALSDLFVRLKADASGFKAGMNTAKREAGLTSKSVKEAENRFFSLQAQIKKTNFDNPSLKTLKGNLISARIEMEKMRKEAGLMNRGGGASGFIEGLKGGIVGGGAVGAGMALVGGAKAQFAETMQLIVDFDDSIRKVAATSQASAGDMNKLRDAALDMGAKTKFTSSEAATALNYMALAGWNANQSIGALPGVLNLAAASGTDLGMTAEIMTDTMNAFSLQAGEAIKVADIFSAAEAKTSTSVEQLGEALTYAAPQMAAANQSLADTAAVLGLVANQGIKGSMAGTAINSMLNDLKKNAKDGTLEFGKMNIALYDQAGRFRNIFDIIGEMKTAVQGLSAQQRDAITGGIFEERSIKAINILLNTTQQQIDDVALSMNHADFTAQRMAATMEGGVGGAMRNAESAWEGFKLSLGDGQTTKAWYQLSASLANGLREIKTEIDETDNSLQAWFKTIVTVGTFAGPFELIKKTIQGIIDKQKELALSTRQVSAEFAKSLQWGGSKGSVAPIGVLAPPTSGGVDKKPKALGGKAADSPASIFRELNRELAITKQHMDFMGQSAEYAVTAVELTEKAIKDIFRTGAKEAKAYAEKLKAEIRGMVAPSRQGDNLSPPQKIDTLDVGVSFKAEMPDDFDEKFKTGISLMEQLDAELASIDRYARMIPGEFDAMGAKLAAAGYAMQEGFAADIPMDQLNELIKKYGELYAASQLLVASQQFAASLAGSAEDSFGSLASGAATAEEALGGFGKAAIAAGLDALKGQLLAAIGGQTKWAAKLGPFGIPIAAAAIGAIFGLAKGALTKTKGVRLAKGGIAYGQTLAEIGEYQGASHNPEVVAPLDKLTGIMKNAMGGGKQGTQQHEFVIRGDQLVTVLANANRKMSKFR